MICLYLSSLISYRKLQMELWILLFKWIMFQLSIMFVVGEIKQKLLCKFGKVFFDSPFRLCRIVNSLQTFRPNWTSVGQSWIWLYFHLSQKGKWRKKEGRNNPLLALTRRNGPSCLKFDGCVCLDDFFMVSLGCLRGIWRVFFGCLNGGLGSLDGAWGASQDL